MTANHLAQADVWTVLDLLALALKQDPRLIEWFDLNLVQRILELARAGRPNVYAEEFLRRRAANQNRATVRDDYSYAETIALMTAFASEREGRPKQ